MAVRLYKEWSCEVGGCQATVRLVFERCTCQTIRTFSLWDAAYGEKKAGDAQPDEPCPIHTHAPTPAHANGWRLVDGKLVCPAHKVTITDIGKEDR